MKTAFGLDLAGYTTGKSALAQAQRTGDRVDLTVFTHHTFAVKQSLGEPFGDRVRAEVELLRTCLDREKVFVDIPIDLQGLPYPGEVAYPWQLTLRPVDRVLGALPALADRIGSPTARFLNLYRVLREHGNDPLGQDLFETYPAGSLKQLGLPSRGYKNKGDIEFQDGAWRAGPLAHLANSLGFVADQSQRLNNDEFDACLCALPGALNAEDILQGVELEKYVRQRLNKVSSSTGGPRVAIAAPKGFVLIRQFPPDLAMRVNRQVQFP